MIPQQRQLETLPVENDVIYHHSDSQVFPNLTTHWSLEAVSRRPRIRLETSVVKGSDHSPTIASHGVVVEVASHCDVRRYPPTSKRTRTDIKIYGYEDGKR